MKCPLDNEWLLKHSLIAMQELGLETDDKTALSGALSLSLSLYLILNFILSHQISECVQFVFVWFFRSYNTIAVVMLGDILEAFALHYIILCHILVSHKHNICFWRLRRLLLLLVVLLNDVDYL